MSDNFGLKIGVDGEREFKAARRLGWGERGAEWGRAGWLQGKDSGAKKPGMRLAHVRLGALGCKL